MTRILLICSLGASAGVHAALAPGHGAPFYLAAALLAAAAALLVLRPSRPAAAAAGVLLAGLLGAYVLEHGLAFDGVGATAKGLEAVGLLLALRIAVAVPPRQPERVATLVLALMVAVLAGAVTPAGEHEHPPGTARHGH